VLLYAMSALDLYSCVIPLAASLGFVSRYFVGSPGDWLSYNLLVKCV